MKKQNKYSKNKKLEKVLSTIELQLEYNNVNIVDYYNNFKNELDYNIAQYGNLLIYYQDVKKMYRDCGYVSLDKMSDQKVWEIYKRQVGYVVRELMK